VLAERELESKRMSDLLLGVDQGNRAATRLRFKPERAKGAKCDYQKLVKVDGERMLLNLYVGKRSLKLSIFNPVKPQIRPVVLELAPTYTSVTNQIGVQSFIREGDVHKFHTQSMPYFRLVSAEANLAMWPFLGPLLQQNALRGNKPILERVCDHMQAILDKISGPPKPQALRPPVPPPEHADKAEKDDVAGISRISKPL